MRRNNFQSLIKDEFVKRFESTVSEEIKRHNAAIESYQLEINKLKQQVVDLEKELFIQKLQNDQLSAKFMKKLADEKEERSVFCSKQELSFELLKKQYTQDQDKLNKELEKLASKDHLLFWVNEIKNSLLSANKGFFDEWNKLYAHFNDLKNKLESNNKVFEQYIHKMDDDNKSEMESLSAKLDVYNVDAKGVLRELQIYKKSMLILEKKIEHIYTLIERSPRGASCPKPASLT